MSWRLTLCCALLGCTAVLTGCHRAAEQSDATIPPGAAPATAPIPRPVVVPTDPQARHPAAERDFVNKLRGRFTDVQASDDNLIRFARATCDLLDAGRTPREIADSYARTFGADPGRLGVAMNTILGVGTTVCPHHRAAVVAWAQTSPAGL